MPGRTLLYTAPRPTSPPPQNQLDTLRAFCALREIGIVREYADKEDSRHDWRLAVEHAGNHQLPIAVYSLTQLGRTAEEALLTLDMLRANQIPLIAFAEQIDGTTAAGAASLDALATAGAMLRADTLAARVVKNSTSKRRRGRPDRVRFGYRPNPENPAELVDDEAEQRTIQVIHLLRAEGMNLSQICRYLDEMQIPRRGGTWSTPHLQRKMVAEILKRPA